MPRPAIEFYLSLNYAITLVPDEGGYFAEIKDLPGCMSQGDSAEEALAMINRAKSAWIRAAYKSRDEIPLPSDEAQFSGRLLLRMPKSLHRSLTEQARDQGVSLNQWVVALLSQSNPLRALQRQLDNLSRQVARFSTIANVSVVVPASRTKVGQFAAKTGASQKEAGPRWTSASVISRVARIES